jgi:hypothetical protein
MLGGYMFEGNQDLENSFTLGAGLEFGLTKKLGHRGLF